MKIAIINLLFLYLIPVTDAFLESMPDGGQVAKFDAIDCSQPTRFRANNFKHLCTQAGKEMLKPQKQTVALLQRLTQTTIKAIRCEKRVSIYNVVCSVWSHSKALGAPDIEKREAFSPRACKQTYVRKTYIAENGEPYAIDKNRKIQMKSILAGSLTPTQNDVRCVGGARKIGRIFHQDVVSMATTTLEMKEVTLEYDSTRHAVKDLDLEVEINPACVDQKQCLDAGFAYVVLENLNTCPFGLLRAGEVEMVELPTTEGTTMRGVLSRTYKYLLRMGESTAENPGCGDLPTPSTTNHPSVYVSKLTSLDQLSPAVKPVRGNDVDLELEISTSKAFLEYRYIEMTMRHRGGLLSALCKMGSTTMPDLTPSPIHDARYWHMAGEVVSEIECKRVEVTARIGDTPVPWCARDLLPVNLDGNQVFMHARSRLLIPEVPDLHTNCTPMGRTMVQSKDGVYVTADPKVRVVQIQISEGEQFNLFEYLGKNLTGLAEDDWGSALLYSHETMQELDAQIHYGLTRDKVIESLTSSYCEQGKCGSFKPTSSSGFDASRILNAAEDALNPAAKMYQTLVHFGLICSIIVALYVIGIGIKFVMGKFCPAISMAPPSWIQRMVRRSAGLPETVVRKSELEQRLEDA